MTLSTAHSVSPNSTHYTVIVVGSGQAGMSMSYHLKQENVSHLVIEKNNEIAYNWKNERWDEFCLVTPNWQCQLPGHHYQGDDPDGFMVKEQIVDYLQSYFDSFKPPVVFNSVVSSITKVDGLFHVETDNKGVKNHYTAEQVVLASGSYHQAFFLPAAKNMPAKIKHVHSRDYKNAASLPEGDVMVVGTGQSGAQIAEDLHLQGRKVHLCVGSAPRVNRRYRGKDVVQWLEDMNYYNTTIDKHPDGANAPHSTNHYVTGRDGGRDLNLRIFAEQGMQLYGQLGPVQNGVATFVDDLAKHLDAADDSAKRITDKIEEYIQLNHIEAPADDNVHSNYLPDSPAVLDMNTSNISTVIWATGFRMNFNWVKLPAFDERGLPLEKRGVSPVDGLYFLGLNWMNTWGSGRFFHVGRDAEFLKEQILQNQKIQEELLSA
ncbi:MSMEG_0569 family flavin-dependent oxidoreductase [Paraglaciecola sp. L3A3]|uniref:MSMEG_0569 family flavin-dependent oxidoreductase n=1 Tax=Paraglaciecola sp. L3A3 TaxID=2686358 RepID=UPI00131DC6B1|nr:MSMEG_0569 family flavin-dependent oxidoreductase [Paraglaciecola sp. L3A3]